MPEAFDAIIIGAGQAGTPLAVKLATAGRRTALIERGELGGTCVNVGCTPTKTLIASARVAHLARHAERWGVRVGPPSIDMPAVKARIDAVIAQSRTGLARWIDSTENLTLIRGEARFTGPDGLAVGERRLRAPCILINAGGRPVVPDWPGLAGVPYLTSSSILALDAVPEHLIVVGGSYIGLEFAQAYRRLGAAVTVLEQAPRLIAREDPEVSDAVRNMLEAEGITVTTGARCLRTETTTGGGVRINTSCDGADATVAGSHLLLALGRRPNTETLELAVAGIATDPRGFIAVDDACRTNIGGVFALGDINGRGAFTHTAYDDHANVAAAILGGDWRPISKRIPAYALFTDPPLARIGASAGEVRAAGRPALMATMPMARVGRARERGETTGFMQVLVDPASRRILGATLFGIEADEAIHVFLTAMQADLPCDVILRGMPIHPTVSELLPTLLERLTPFS